MLATSSVKANGSTFRINVLTLIAVCQNSVVVVLRAVTPSRSHHTQRHIEPGTLMERSESTTAHPRPCLHQTHHLRGSGFIGRQAVQLRNALHSQQSSQQDVPEHPSQCTTLQHLCHLAPEQAHHQRAEV